MADYIKIEMNIISGEQSEILIAELSEINFEAFEEKENLLEAFVKKKDFNESELNKIVLSKNISYKKFKIKSTNWNEKWESEFERVRVNAFVAVRASFHKPITNVLHEIIITPKMSFGTAHHPTTWLMLRQMEKMDFNNKTVLDFGTGTGILAILAKKLGAKSVTAIDNDEWSITNAEENFSANNCCDIQLYNKDNLMGFTKFDIILSNINLNVIIANSDNFKNISHHTQLLLSGFLKKDTDMLLSEFGNKGFIFNQMVEKEGWVSVLLTNA